MIRRFRILSLSVLLPLFAFTGCREESSSCSQPRAFHDTLGARLEKERIELQWARVKGTFDSMVSTREGKDEADRAARSHDQAAARYKDSLVRVSESVRFRDGCVDWNATWAQGDFDRQAMASALLARLLTDSGYSALEFTADTTVSPRFVDIEALPASPGPQRLQKTVRVRLDSLKATLDPAKN